MLTPPPGDGKALGQQPLWDGGIMHHLFLPIYHYFLNVLRYINFGTRIKETHVSNVFY